jgi:DnaJ-class molecular chaperone
MKPIEEQTYYEILEVSPTATAKEIQKAYERAKETFHTDSLAVYSLFTEKEIEGIQAAIEEAYRVLMDEALRKRYDQSHIRTPDSQKGEKYPEVQNAQEKKGSLSFTELSFKSGEEIYRGKTLRQVRERMGIDLKTISGETKINVKILEWIEEEAVDKLPTLVYLKGFLRGYAKSLDLDPQKVVEGYLRFLAENKKK